MTTTTACSVIDLERYRELRSVSSSVRPAQSVGGVPVASRPVAVSSPQASPALSEALALLGRELRSAELRLIDLAATIDELYAQVDEMARR